jgi:hypothetical protein
MLRKALDAKADIIVFIDYDIYKSVFTLSKKVYILNKPIRYPRRPA